MMARALAAEFMKLKRSPMPLWTALVVLVASGLGLAVIPVLSDPATQAKLLKGGGVFAKAVETGAYAVRWESVLRIGVQGMTGSWGILVFGLVAAYVFGREYNEGTARNLLTLPIRREYVVAGKIVVVGLWVFAMGLLSVLASMVVAALLGADGFSWGVVARDMRDTVTAITPIYCTLPLVAWFAMLGRGYLPPMLFSLATMMAQNGAFRSAASRWVPWSMPIHVVGASWHPVPPSPLTASSWLVAVAVFAVGMALVMWHVDHADSPA